ncbi:MAG: hypothetical protein IPK83_19400 [Planctomycetes bacterium]|nr:hypothetical protein [Planctomycetota bacterium]
MHFQPGKYLFEETHWWLTQIARLADEWLDDLFGDKRNYQLEDFAELYRTNLSILGRPARDDQAGMRHAFPALSASLPPIC